MWKWESYRNEWKKDAGLETESEMKEPNDCQKLIETESKVDAGRYKSLRLITNFEFLWQHNFDGISVAERFSRLALSQKL